MDRNGNELPRVEHAVARIVAQTARPVEAFEALLEAVGCALGWRLGAIWLTDAHTGRLHCARSWHAGPPIEEFEALSAALTLAPGEGLPGRVLASGEPAWILDTPEDANFPRATAARRAGLHAGLAFPLRSARGVVGVMEFFSSELREPNPPLLASLTAVGSQVGQLVEQRRAEAEIRASESRLRAMLEAALDAVVTMDHQGRVLGWNHAAETIFGYPASETLGRDMAELIIPARLRRAHRAGLARFRTTEQAVVLDRRLELTGVRSDGREFPVELTITRIALPGPPTFTGYLRDISDRVQADRELRASRARLVEVADAERRRVQRNLHDGAQQRLTSALLCLGRLRAAAHKPEPLLDVAIDEISAGLEELRELASGLHPSVLTQRGLGAALEALALRSPIGVELAALPDRRLPEPVEAGAYYVVAEALANVHKHAHARRVVVRAVTAEQRVEVSVVDDGVGGADADGPGLRGLADRVEALGGRLEVVDQPRGGTSLRASIPDALGNRHRKDAWVPAGGPGG